MAEELTELHVENPNEAIMLLGMGDANIKLIEESFNCRIITRGEIIQITGEVEQKKQVTLLLKELLKVIRKGINIDLRDVSSAIEMLNKGTLEYFSELYDVEIGRTHNGKPIRAKTIGQRCEFVGNRT